MRDETLIFFYSIFQEVQNQSLSSDTAHVLFFVTAHVLLLCLNFI